MLADACKYCQALSNTFTPPNYKMSPLQFPAFLALPVVAAGKRPKLRLQCAAAHSAWSAGCFFLLYPDIRSYKTKFVLNFHGTPKTFKIIHESTVVRPDFWSYNASLRVMPCAIRTAVIPRTPLTGSTITSAFAAVTVHSAPSRCS
jgi:hypothetical protein